MAPGFVYRGAAAPELNGKYVFADFVPGRVFYTNADEMRRGGDHLATVHELMLFNDRGQQVTMQELAGDARVDLRFGADRHNELYVLAKANGKIWKVIGTRQARAPTSTPPR